MKPYHNTNRTNISNTIEKIRLEDYRYSQIVKRGQIIYWVFIFIYSIITIAHIVEGCELNELFSSVFNLLGMLTFALLFRSYSKEYKQADYSLPTLVMLKKAADRYQPFRKKTWYIALAAIMFNASLSLSNAHAGNFLNLQLTFAGVIAVAILIGLFIWKQQYKPLRDDALALIRQIEGE